MLKVKKINKTCHLRVFKRANKKTPLLAVLFILVERDGFEPSKLIATDLQSAPFGHSGTYPCFKENLEEDGAGEGT